MLVKQCVTLGENLKTGQCSVCLRADHVHPCLYQVLCAKHFGQP